MNVYALNNGRLNIIDHKSFKLEKDIQKLCEENLSLLFGLEVVTSEFYLHNLRIDTIAFDPKAESFVVLEYKNDKNFSVIDQGYAYLALILNNKAECILEYNETHKTPVKRNTIDWTQTRVIFIAPSFTPYQTQSINFKDLPIELWEIKKYENDTISLRQIQPYGSSESIKTISSKNKTIEGVTKEVKVYTEDEHLLVASDEIKELYNQLKTYLTSFKGDVRIKPTKKYIGFIARTNFVDVHIQKNALKLWLNLSKGRLDDSKQLARDVSNIGHWGNGDYELHFSDADNLDYILGLVKQSYISNAERYP